CECYFFFQAEDGIRDFHVTGVQTCALPISSPTHCCRLPTSIVIALQQKEAFWSRRLVLWPPRPEGIASRTHSIIDSCPRLSHHRSEERRVGKEGGSRWRPSP